MESVGQGRVDFWNRQWPVASGWLVVLVSILGRKCEEWPRSLVLDHSNGRCFAAWIVTEFAVHVPAMP